MAARRALSEKTYGLRLKVKQLLCRHVHPARCSRLFMLMFAIYTYDIQIRDKRA